MKMIYLGLWGDFVCRAGACPSTCCAGWNIVVDEQTIARIRELPTALELREVILRHIHCKNGEYRFENRTDGRCSMLREDGLCRIWHEAGEALLCNTCRKFPQLIDREGETIRLSMDASCPVVAEYLWREKIEWFCVQNVPDEAGRTAEVSAKKKRCDAFVWTRTQKDRESCEKLRRKLKDSKEYNEVKSGLNVPEVLWDVMEGCLNLLLQSPEISYLEGSFDYFEDWSEERFISGWHNLSEIWRQDLRRFAANYVLYRMFGLSFSDSRVEEEDRIPQLLGELSLFYITFFSRFQVMPEISEAQVVENINWVYRFTAHGLERQRRVTNWFVENRRKLELFFDIFYL